MLLFCELKNLWMCWIYYTLQNLLGGVGGWGADWALVIGLPAVRSRSRLKKIHFFRATVLLDTGPANWKNKKSFFLFVCFLFFHFPKAPVPALIAAFTQSEVRKISVSLELLSCAVFCSLTLCSWWLLLGWFLPFPCCPLVFSRYGSLSVNQSYGSCSEIWKKFHLKCFGSAPTLFDHSGELWWSRYRTGLLSAWKWVWCRYWQKNESGLSLGHHPWNRISRAGFPFVESDTFESPCREMIYLELSFHRCWAAWIPTPASAYFQQVSPARL